MSQTKFIRNTMFFSNTVSSDESNAGNCHSHAERIDRDVTGASLAAEAALPKYDEPTWSVELANARKRVLLLSKVLSALRTKLDPQVFLASVTPSELAAEPLPSTIIECTTKLREAKQLVKTIVSESFAKRDAERKQRIQTLELSHAKVDKERAQLLRRLQKAEDIKELFKKIRHLRAKGSRRGVTRIEIPKNSDDDLQTCTEWVQIDVPSEIVDRLQARHGIVATSAKPMAHRSQCHRSVISSDIVPTAQVQPSFSMARLTIPYMILTCNFSSSI